MQKIILTRALEDSLYWQKLLLGVGIESIISPAFKFESLEFKVPQKDYKALIVTSIQAVSGEGVSADILKLPVFVVGEKCAAFLREKGFSNIVQIVENVGMLDCFLPLSQPPPRGGRGIKQGEVLYLSGADVSEDIAGVDRIITYKASAQGLGADVAHEFEAGNVGAVSFFSTRTAQIFVESLRKNKIITKNITAICFSENIASSLDENQWKNILYSNKTTEKAMLQLMQEL